MIKLKHNKKRNIAFIYEVLIKELSKASMNESNEKKQKIITILKSFFHKSAILKEELDIHQSFNDVYELDEPTAEKLIFEARYQASLLNKNLANKNKTKIVNLINKELGQKSWDTYVENYKKLATIDQAVFSKLNPKKQVFVEKKLINLLTSPKEKKQHFPNVNNLALKTFLENFNNQYSEALNESQKKLLNKYIVSDDEESVDFKLYLYEEVDRLKAGLLEKIDRKDENSKKFQLIIEKIDGYSKKRIDKNMISEIIKIQSLVGELKDAVDA